MQEQLDPSIIALTKAIGHQESGGDYNKVGDNGHSVGAYQWNNPTPVAKGQIPKNFASYATEVSADPNDFSPTNQDRVAYKTVEKWGKSGLTPAQIASKWNSGSPDTYKTAKPGYNAEQGVNYDVKSYVDNVAKYYDQYKGSTTTHSTPTVKDTVVGEPGNTQPHSGFLGTNPNDSTYGKIIDNGITRGVEKLGNILTFGGAGQLGNEVGGALNAAGQGIKGVAQSVVGNKEGAKKSFENFNNAADAVDTGKAFSGGAKAIAGTALLAGGSLLGNAFKANSALASPEVTSILEGSVGKGEVVANLTREEAINGLGNALKEMPISEAGGKTEQLILKALKELNPTSIEKKNLLLKLAKGGLNTAKNYLLVKALGNTTGGFIHKVTPSL